VSERRGTQLLPVQAPPWQVPVHQRREPVVMLRSARRHTPRGWRGNSADELPEVLV